MKILTTIFYSPSENIAKGLVHFNSEESQHIVKVLRAHIGDQIIITDGNGFATWVELERADEKRALGKIIDDELPHLSPELPVKITLGVGIIRPQRFESMIEMLVQLGASEIVPLFCRYSEPAAVHRLQAEDSKKRLERIVLASMKSSLRTFLPFIHEPIELIDFLNQNSKHTIFFGDPDGLPILPQKTDSSFNLLIGPEGGFNHREIESIRDCGGLPINLGRTRLRTETAAITLLTKTLVGLAYL
jgi:16S rRNA (uracil1498-N3)-methyltransferase